MVQRQAVVRLSFPIEPTESPVLYRWQYRFLVIDELPIPCPVRTSNKLPFLSHRRIFFFALVMCSNRSSRCPVFYMLFYLYKVKLSIRITSFKKMPYLRLQVSFLFSSSEILYSPTQNEPSDRKVSSGPEKGWNECNVTSGMREESLCWFQSGKQRYFLVRNRNISFECAECLSLFRALRTNYRGKEPTLFLAK